MRVRPPQMVCEKLRYQDVWRGIKIDKTVPAVFHAAYEAADGTRAVSLVNATDEERRGSLVFPDGSTRDFTLAPREITFKGCK